MPKRTIKRTKPKTCRLCLAETKQGALCKRLSACKIGCRYFCFQHAKIFGGIYKPKEKCNEKLKICKPCKSPTHEFPCKKKTTVFFNSKDFEEWCQMVRAKRV